MYYNNTEIKIIKGDLTTLAVDAIVNAANKSLTGGGGVDGAIQRAAGPELAKACLRLGGCKTGEAKITLGYDLPVKFVIHTVGPLFGQEDGFEASYLEDCYKNCLTVADSKHIKTIAFPAIATGVYGYPVEEAAPIALETTQEYLSVHPQTEIKEITFVCFSDYDLKTYEEFAADIF